jgi:CRISPR-associated endoribonuclease Cas6
MTFECRVVRYKFAALEPIYFPPGKAGNMLRGAFGMLPDAGSIFRPQSAEPSGLQDPPRPFVFRAAHLEGHGFKPGEAFRFDVHLFDEHIPAQIFGGIWSRRASLLGFETARISINFEPRPASVAVVKFLTPTELKPAGLPEFCILLARCRDRVSTLRALYGPGPLAIDFRKMGAEARKIHMARCELRHLEFERRSSRTGQTHPLGGFTGEVRYEGTLDDFVPFLRAAEVTGVGRHTVWGKGAIAVEIS